MRMWAQGVPVFIEGTVFAVCVHLFPQSWQFQLIGDFSNFPPKHVTKNVPKLSQKYPKSTSV